MPRNDRRSDGSLAGLLAAMPRIASVAEVLPFVSRLPTGLHLLAAPDDPDAMAQITPAAYGELLAFLGQYYELIILDLGTGITDPLARFAVERSDQVVLVTTPEWITATTVTASTGAASPGQDLAPPRTVAASETTAASDMSAASAPRPPAAARTTVAVGLRTPLRGHTYTVKPGDSLWLIAKSLLPSGASNAQIAKLVNRIWTLNATRIGTGSPNPISSGTKLALPAGV